MHRRIHLCLPFRCDGPMHREGQIGLPLQTHKNIMAVATLKDLAAIILVKGFKPESDTLEASLAEGIPVLGSDLEAFELSGELFNILK